MIACLPLIPTLVAISALLALWAVAMAYWSGKQGKQATEEDA